jgi:mRNA-degrading endonuclease RelE of RelBE toxin-antitoxin system
MRQRVIIPETIRREIGNMGNRHRQRVLAVLTILSNEPRRGRRLHGIRRPVWSYRVWPYRILYQMEKQTLIVLAMGAGRRHTIY